VCLEENRTHSQFIGFFSSLLVSVTKQHYLANFVCRKLGADFLPEAPERPLSQAHDIALSIVQTYDFGNPSHQGEHMQRLQLLKG
jgi:hypothetical protein